MEANDEGLWRSIGQLAQRLADVSIEEIRFRIDQIQHSIDEHEAAVEPMRQELELLRGVEVSKTLSLAEVGTGLAEGHPWMDASRRRLAVVELLDRAGRPLSAKELHDGLSATGDQMALHSLYGFLGRMSDDARSPVFRAGRSLFAVAHGVQTAPTSATKA